MVGYFEMLNAKGGINGRKINFTQLDNAYSAPKAVEQSRKLIEDVGVLAEVGTIGTAPNVAIQKYLNAKQAAAAASSRPADAASTIPRPSRGRFRSIRTSRPRAASSPSTS